jgi:hypothetical protein
MMTIRIQVRQVDMYGFCGRERHPEAADQGLLGTVQSMRLETLPADQGLLDTETAKERQVQVFTVLLSNGQTRELLGHEFALYGVVRHDGDL